MPIRSREAAIREAGKLHKREAQRCERYLLLVEEQRVEHPQWGRQLVAVRVRCKSCDWQNYIPIELVE